MSNKKGKNSDKIYFIIFLVLFLTIVTLNLLGIYIPAILPLNKFQRLERKIKSQIKNLVKDVEITEDKIKQSNAPVDMPSDILKKVNNQLLNWGSLHSIRLNKGYDNMNNDLKKLEENIEKHTDSEYPEVDKLYFVKKNMKKK